jgi:hypothetical protein
LRQAAFVNDYQSNTHHCNFFIVGATAATMQHCMHDHATTGRFATGHSNGKFL